PTLHVSLLAFHPRLSHPGLHSFPTRRSSDLANHRGKAEYSIRQRKAEVTCLRLAQLAERPVPDRQRVRIPGANGDEAIGSKRPRSEEHTSELQSLAYLVCRLLLEKQSALRGV